MKEHKKLMQRLNDAFRQTFNGGKVVLTKNISILPSEELSAIVHKVQTYNNFNKDNDPYGEHDFGSFEHNGNTIFWKIDYYDSEYCFFSNNPACASSTNRVLSIMFAYEY